MAIISKLDGLQYTAMATAYNITPQVVATWSPHVYRAPRVLVPIELDVLVVRDPAQKWAECGMSEPLDRDVQTDGTVSPAEDPNPTASESLIPPPFTDKLTPRPVGAYLHWYLPNALTSGTSDAVSDSATFPAIPDRWLILRISTSNTPGRRAVRGWVLDSTKTPRQSVDLQNWIEPGANTYLNTPLTALGVGELSWAGYYDNVENRLGFCDSTLVSDQVVGPLAYLVCGWYADPLSDPLGGQTIISSAAFADKLQELGWQVDQKELDDIQDQATRYRNAFNTLNLRTTDPFQPLYDKSPAPAIEPNWWPRAVLLHGAAVGIGWPNAVGDAEVGGPPSASQIKVAVGNTMAEAMGTLVARVNGVAGQAAIVEALQLGVIRELEQPDGRAQLDLAVHASSFASLSGGVATAETIDIAPSGPPPGPPADPQAPAPGIFNAAAPPADARQSAPQFNRMATANAFSPAAAETVAQTFSPIQVSSGYSRAMLAEENLHQGDFSHLIKQFELGPVVPVSDPGGTFAVSRPQPRRYTPKDPVVLIAGGNRTFVHDSDVHTDDGVLNCRLATVTELTWAANGQSHSVKGEDILLHGVQNGSVPAECDVLLNETVLLDPGSAAAAATASATMAAAIAGANAARVSAAAIDPAAARQHIQVEQTVWWALRDPRIDHSALIARSGLTGTLPAPFAISPPAHPWTPMHLDWAVEFVPSPGGVDDWELHEIDFILAPGKTVPPAGGGISMQGRAMLTAGASSALAGSVRIAQVQAASIGGTGPVPLATEAFYSEMARDITQRFASLNLGGNQTGGVGGDPADADRSLLSDIATELDQMDVLSCGLNGLLKNLRGGLEADGEAHTQDGSTPLHFVALRAGALYFKRLRLVDGFGQYVDLCGSDESHPVRGEDLLVSDALGVTPLNAIGLPPRFTAPTRLAFRYMSADSLDAGPQSHEADATTSPVCAFVMPNHLDGGLEFFNADGSSAGNLFSGGDGQVRWEDAPGSVTAAGQNPARALANPFAGQLANALIDWGVADADGNGSNSNSDTALLGMLRTIDTTLWTIDPFAHAGDEHLSLLVGHPVAVMRAMLRLEVEDPVTTPDGTVTAVPVELGHLAHWQDGLLGYFVNDDYTTLYSAVAAVEMARPSGPQQGFLEQINLVPQFYAGFAADIGGTATGQSAVNHPYIDGSGRIWVRPNQTVMLTMLVEPFTSVHATAGLVPRKEIGMRRAWVTDGLAKIAPTFRFGPVLMDPQRIRMPLATDIKGAWVWDYRADAVKWNEGNVSNATDNALLAPDPPTAIEGWLRLEPPPASGSG